MRLAKRSQSKTHPSWQQRLLNHPPRTLPSTFYCPCTTFICLREHWNPSEQLDPDLNKNACSHFRLPKKVLTPVALQTQRDAESSTHRSRCIFQRHLLMPPEKWNLGTCTAVPQIPMGHGLLRSRGLRAIVLGVPVQLADSDQDRCRTLAFQSFVSFIGSPDFYNA